jgi:hypothetical protein
MSSKLGAIFFLYRTFPQVLRISMRFCQSQIEQGGTAEAAINGVNETIGSMINRSSFLGFLGEKWPKNSDILIETS